MRREEREWRGKVVKERKKKKGETEIFQITILLHNEENSAQFT